MKRRNFSDPAQVELFTHGLGLSKPHPFRLRVGDFVSFDGRLCRVVSVNDCAAVLMMNRPVRRFTTRFDRPVCIQPPPALFRISPQSEVPILNRRRPEN
jgi:hypothetical protein